MKLKSLALAAVAATTLVAAPAFAAISGGGTQTGANAVYSGNGELFLSVYDEAAKISYTKDLGITQNQYLALSQPYLNSFSVNDANWNSFLGQVDATNLRWVVMAVDNSVGAFRLLTTIKNGDEALMAQENILAFKSGVGAGQAGNFFSAVNVSGTHGATGTAPNFTVNGTSVNNITENGRGYFGELGGLTSNLNGNFTVDFSNVVGATAHFQMATNLSPEVGDPVAVTYFYSSWNFSADADGNYVLTSVPEASTLASMLAGLAVLGGLVRRRLSA